MILLERVWEGVGPELRRLALAFGLDGSRADDVVQEVYLTALQKLPAEVDSTGLRRWLFRVAANKCRLEHRSRRRWLAKLDHLARWLPAFSATECSAQQTATDSEERRIVRAALERLGNEARLVLILRYFHDFHSSEIGTILSLPSSTVRSQLRKARMALARELRRSGLTDKHPT